MKITAAKVEEIEVEVTEEQIETLMCELLKADYFEWKSVAEEGHLDALATVYEMYSGKPIDFEGRFDN